MKIFNSPHLNQCVFKEYSVTLFEMHKLTLSTRHFTTCKYFEFLSL